MAQKIIERTDWLGNNVQDLYENGSKVGETRVTGKDWNGNDIKETYDNSGNKVSETRVSDGFFDSGKWSVTRDNSGKKLSETRTESNIFGGTVEHVYDSHNKKVAEVYNSDGFFGKNISVIEKKGAIDLTTRTLKKSSDANSIEKKLEDSDSKDSPHINYEYGSGNFGYSSSSKNYASSKKETEGVEKKESSSVIGALGKVALGVVVLGALFALDETKKK